MKDPQQLTPEEREFSDIARLARRALMTALPRRYHRLLDLYVCLEGIYRNRNLTEIGNELRRKLADEVKHLAQNLKTPGSRAAEQRRLQ